MDGSKCSFGDLDMLNQSMKLGWQGATANLLGNQPQRSWRETPSIRGRRTPRPVVQPSKQHCAWTTSVVKNGENDLGRFVSLDLHVSHGSRRGGCVVGGGCSRRRAF
jgi:hypothetical protein